MVGSWTISVHRYLKRTANNDPHLCLLPPTIHIPLRQTESKEGVELPFDATSQGRTADHTGNAAAAVVTDAGCEEDAASGPGCMAGCVNKANAAGVA